MRHSADAAGAHYGGARRHVSTSPTIHITSPACITDLGSLSRLHLHIHGLGVDFCLPQTLHGMNLSSFKLATVLSAVPGPMHLAAAAAAERASRCARRVACADLVLKTRFVDLFIIRVAANTRLCSQLLTLPPLLAKMIYLRCFSPPPPPPPTPCTACA